MDIKNSFEIGEILYLKHDIEQLPRMVTGIKINPYDITYEVISGIEVSNHYDFELSKEKTIY
jgi:hypothetical protein